MEKARLVFPITIVLFALAFCVDTGLSQSLQERDFGSNQAGNRVYLSGAEPSQRSNREMR